MSTVCFTGHRPGSLGGYDIDNKFNYKIILKLEKVIEQLISDGYDTFISGGALGVDQWTAEIIINLKKKYYPHIKLIIARPFPSQSSKWPKGSQEYFKWLCSQADEVTDVCQDPYAAWKMQIRNEWMVKKSDLVVAVWNGSNGGTANCVRYAEKQGKEIIRINPNELK